MIVNIGLDLAHVDRFIFSDKETAWFAARVFTAEEMRYATSRRYPQQHLAGAFAAKEAFRKALGQPVPWREIGVIHDDNGAPKFAFGTSAHAKLVSLGDIVVHLSITHTAGDAAATVILERRV